MELLYLVKLFLRPSDLLLVDLSLLSEHFLERLDMFVGHFTACKIVCEDDMRKGARQALNDRLEPQEADALTTRG